VAAGSSSPSAFVNGSIARGEHGRLEDQTMTLIQGLLQEFEREAQTTRRVLERVPNDKLHWRPHPKSRTLGELALHIATAPAGVAELSAQSPAQAPRFAGEASPANVSELMSTLERTVERTKALLGGIDDLAATQTWRLMNGDRELLAMPRIAFLRAIMLNHWYHHRGQLTVYLRQLDVPIPSIYGPSADENPFG
jgi:uncharacterized damage-inducible protein DinB